MTAARRIAALLALLALPVAFVAVAASPAAAHPPERCFFGWTEVDDAPLDGSPDNPVQVCLDQPCSAYSSLHFVEGAPDDFICVWPFGSHRHPWRDGIIRLASFAALCPLMYALIMTPEALRQEKATRRGRWRLIARPRQLYRALPRRHWLAYWCGFAPAFLFSSAAAPLLLEWLFPHVGTITVTIYAAACGLIALVGWRIWTRKRQQGERAALQQSQA